VYVIDCVDPTHSDACLLFLKCVRHPEKTVLYKSRHLHVCTCIYTFIYRLHVFVSVQAGFLHVLQYFPEEIPRFLAVAESRYCKL